MRRRGRGGYRFICLELDVVGAMIICHDNPSLPIKFVWVASHLTREDSAPRIVSIIIDTVM